MIINGRAIGADHPTYVIAEMSNNHLGNIENAYQIIRAAAKAGADAVKIQTYCADSLTIDCRNVHFQVPAGSPWEGRYYYELYKEISMPLEWTESLFRVARDEGITLFSSPFDEAAVSLLESHGCPAYKVASFEAQDDPLLKSVAATSKPVIVSSGVSRMSEMEETVSILKAFGCSEIAVLHCVSEYPAKVCDMNLASITRLGSLGCLVGLSDHSLGYEAAMLAVARGAVIIEKHITLNRSDGGPDASFSLEPVEFLKLVEKIREAYDAMGDPNVLDIRVRKGAEHARSLFAVRDISMGSRIGEADIRAIRPGIGLPPRMMAFVIGKIATRDILYGDPIKEGDFQ